MESRGEERSACLLHHRGLENSGGPLAESSQRKGSDLPEGVAVPLLVLVAVCWRSWGVIFLMPPLFKQRLLLFSGTSATHTRPASVDGEDFGLRSEMSQRKHRK